MPVSAFNIADASHGYARQVTYDEVHLMFAIKFFPPENKRNQPRNTNPKEYYSKGNCFKIVDRTRCG